MSDLISGEALLEKIKENQWGWFSREMLLLMLENQPTVKAIPVQALTDAILEKTKVVRCKDCKHWHKETAWCAKHSHFIDSEGNACHPWESSNWKMFNENDFCSDGEMRDNAVD